MKRNSFTFNQSMYSLLSILPKWKINKFIRKIVEYGINGTEPRKLSKLEKSLFVSFQRMIDDEKKLSNIRSWVGKQGGAPKNNANAHKNKQKQPKTSKINSKTTKNKQNNNAFFKPEQTFKPFYTKKQIEVYCLAYGLDCDAGKLFEYCVSNRITDWRSVAETWGKN